MEKDAFYIILRSGARTVESRAGAARSGGGAVRLSVSRRTTLCAFAFLWRRYGRGAYQGRYAHYNSRWLSRRQRSTELILDGLTPFLAPAEILYALSA